MRGYPDMDDEYDRNEVEMLKPEPWMLNLLKLNPYYCHWGPYEDYMCGRDGWGGSLTGQMWDGCWSLDELNEVVNFYFELSRDSVPCNHCGQTGLSPFGRRMEVEIYSMSKSNLTQEEVDILWESQRFYGHKEKPTVPEANSLIDKKMVRHDAINCALLIKHRCEKAGEEEWCAHCNGEGHVYTADACHVNLVIWVLHPRKGASRGVEFTHIKQEDLPSIFKFLSDAEGRNRERFARVVAAHWNWEEFND